MATIQSVLTNTSRQDLRTDPFPYLVVENCLPPALYAELAAAYPSDDSILDLNAARRGGRVRQNQRNNVSAHQAIGRGTVADVWEEFVRFHTSPAFYADVMRVFGDSIRQSYPALEKRLGGPLEGLATGVRFDAASDTGAISLDCQIAINTSVQRFSSVRGVHADAPQELFAMLLYFRRPEDDSTGGDLEIWRWKPGRWPRFIGNEADESAAEFVATIAYQPNTLVAFVNSEYALHAISNRSVTPHSRRLVNLIGEVYRPMPEGLFVKRQKPMARLLRFQRSMRHKLGLVNDLGHHQR
ncbi:hypothetical protein [Xylophilus sp. GOD-11R]|uniref:hypothetical protein n=1 Tax=Xylophilus sp. GOD-11R TaxID=3089814 RepID=UPI00298D54C3|nr:hypothetical protein [Xylophilus sp. GOD-11R]WPB56518.1 hypothetical protein R9X41_20605 [Xylophilus sp. GOD-11R]